MEKHSGRLRYEPSPGKSSPPKISSLKWPQKANRHIYGGWPQKGYSQCRAINVGFELYIGIESSIIGFDFKMGEFCHFASIST